jgi:hypothetical protein
MSTEDQIRAAGARQTSMTSSVLAIIEPSVAADYVEFRSTQRSSAVQFASLAISRPTHTARLAVGYRRCTEFDGGDSAGQDFVVVRVNPEHVVAVVADGVSQSFFGDLAAAHVAQALIDYLWAERVAPPDMAAMEALLHAASKSLEPQVNSRPISAHLPNLQKAALERTRTSGSQAVFTAAVMTLQTRALRLFQVGDVPAVIRRGQAVERHMAKPEGRWSSTDRSQHHLKITDFPEVSAILLKSDGLPSNWGESLQEATLCSADGFAALAHEEAAKDDMSYFALIVQPAATSLVKLPSPRLPVKSPERRPTADHQPPRPAESRAWFLLLWRAAALKGRPGWVSAVAILAIVSTVWWISTRADPVDITTTCEVLNPQGADAILTIVIRAGRATAVGIARNGASYQDVALDAAAASRWRIITRRLTLRGRSDTVFLRLLAGSETLAQASLEATAGSACSIVIFVPRSER